MSNEHTTTKILLFIIRVSILLPLLSLPDLPGPDHHRGGLERISERMARAREDDSLGGGRVRGVVVEAVQVGGAAAVSDEEE